MLLLIIHLTFKGLKFDETTRKNFFKMVIIHKMKLNKHSVAISITKTSPKEKKYSKKYFEKILRENKTQCPKQTTTTSNLKNP